MIRYFARYDTEGNLITLGTISASSKIENEITAEKYAELLATIPEPEPPISELDEALAILSGEVTE